MWFTDHGKGRRASVDRGGLYYIPPDATPGDGAVREVAFPLLGPNGVGLSPDGRRVYVAETHTGRLWAWDLDAPGVVRPAAGSLAIRHGGVCVAATPFSFDSLAIEEDGRIAIGAIGDGIVVVTPDGSEIDVHPIPGDVTTNLAFGGADGRRAVITLSRSGRLVEAQWPRPGLVVHRPGPVPARTERPCSRTVHGRLTTATRDDPDAESRDARHGGAVLRGPVVDVPGADRRGVPPGGVADVARRPAIVRRTSACCSTTSRSTCSGWRRPRCRAAWSSASTRRIAATSSAS